MFKLSHADKGFAWHLRKTPYVGLPERVEACATLSLSYDDPNAGDPVLLVAWSVEVHRGRASIHDRGEVQVASVQEANAVIESTIIPAHKLAVRRAEAALAVEG